MSLSGGGAAKHGPVLHNVLVLPDHRDDHWYIRVNVYNSQCMVFQWGFDRVNMPLYGEFRMEGQASTLKIINYHKINTAKYIVYSALR